MIYTEELPLHPLLGRHVQHDERSKNFAYTTTLGRRTVRHHSHIGVLDQGQVGSCTGNAATKNISYISFWKKGQTVLTKDLVADEEFAVGVYSDAEVIDGNLPYSPDDPATDNGSTGLSVAKVLKNRGLISSYQHTFTLDAALDAISNRSVICGINWYEDMFYPDENGFITPRGALAGGHEICIDEINCEEQYIEFPNSWGKSWGLRGRARLTWDDFGYLLRQHGDVTVLIP